MNQASDLAGAATFDAQSGRSAPGQAAVQARVQVDRVLHLDISVDAAWELVGTAAGWERWLVDRAGLEVRPGATGEVDDDAVVREVRIGSVERGRRVTFSWSERDDPTTVSDVTIELVEGPEGTTVRITERLEGERGGVGAVAAGAEARSRLGFAWEVRAAALWACTVQPARV